MNKLQLYIYKSRQGYKSVRNINPAENVQRHIHEMRQALDVLDYDPTEKNLFYLLSYIDEGAFFTILRTIPDKHGDHLATTIFVPNGLKITAEEMTEVVRHTTRMISNQAVSADDLVALHETFAREYAYDAAAPAMVASEGHQYAVCRYGGSTGRELADFFGEKLYQPQYLPYAGVVLYDEELGVSSQADDFTDEPLQQTVALLPPEPSADGFTPHIFHRPFTAPFSVPLGSEVTVIWRRGGFEDQKQVVVIEEDGMQVPTIATDDSRKAISPASFLITAQGSKAQVNEPVITVNGVEITEAKTFTRKELQSAEVIIRATGFAPFHGQIDLAAATQARIQLQELRKVYRFELPVKAELGSPIKFEIHTKRELTTCPIEGYSLLDNIREGSQSMNHLDYTGPTAMPRRTVLIVTVAAFILGIMLGWLLLGGSNSSDKADATPSDTTAVVTTEAPATTQPAKTAEQPKAEPKAAEKPAEAAQPAATQAAAPAAANALAYLDGNQSWSREELEKFPELRGLFDDMNNFRLEKIVSTWGPKLSKSKNFARVADAASKKKFKPAAGETYCQPGDTKINFINYTYRIDK